jgi:hypothetical protein
MDNETRMSLLKVIRYLLTDEERDWEERGNPVNHIYNDVRRLQDWFVGN